MSQGVVFASHLGSEDCRGGCLLSTHLETCSQAHQMGCKKPTKAVVVISHGDSCYGGLTAGVRNGSSTKHEADHSLQGMYKGIWVSRF